MDFCFFHCYTSLSTFIIKDDYALTSLGKALKFRFKTNKKFLLPISFLEQLFALLIFGWKIDIFIIQFAGYHSLLPCLFARLTGKKSIIISGGTDCVSFPNLGYGNFNRPFLRSFTRWSYLLCTAIAPKHESLWYTGYNYDSKEPAFQGIRAFVPELKEKHTAIPNGYDCSVWKADPSEERRPNHFITVSGAFEYPFQVQLKGIDLILQTAPHFPDCHFTILGVPEWKKLDIQSSNVTVCPPVENSQLPKLFSSYAFYIQLSMAEGFPNALCEAMLCGCTPIVSNVFSMPEIVQDIGFILHHRNSTEFRELLEQACKKGPNDPDVVRRKITERYGINERKKALVSLLHSLVPGHSN
jgi:glycosyltransferase involved in cell wall biosynthesis